MTRNPYDEHYIEDHMSDFYAFVSAVREHWRSAGMDTNTIAVLYVSMRRDR